MELGSVAENETESESSLRLFLRCSRSQEQHNEEGPDVGLNKIWEGQWPSLVKDWPNFYMQSCDSPIASGSSSSLSTRDSSFFSWSEGSYSAAKHVLHSPEPLSSRFSGFSLFNSGVNHLECACRESFSSEVPASRDDKQDDHALHNADMACKVADLGQRECRVNDGGSRPECERDAFNEDRQSIGVEDHLEGGWVSDTSNSGSRASVSSEEFQRKDLCNDADDVHLARLHSEHQHLYLTGSLCEQIRMPNAYMDATLNAGGVVKCGSCSLDKNDGDCACSTNTYTHSGAMVAEKSYGAVPHQQPKARYLPEECHKGYGIQGGHSVRADSIARLLHGSHDHFIPTCTTVVDGREPFPHRKASYSAAVKERFASSTMHGYLRFAEQGGSPCYSFFLDDSDEVLFARASRQERKSNKENCEWAYSFHSKKDIAKVRGAWKSWPKKENLVSDLVANMRVSGRCHLKARSNQDGRAKEARFVLYDGGVHQQAESPRAGSTNKTRGQPLKPMFDNTLTPQAGQLKEGIKACLTNSDVKAGAMKITARHPNGRITGGDRADAAKEELRFQEFSKSKLKPNPSQQAELAAIIISTSVKEKKINKKKESQVPHKDATTGWGIKFLEKGTQSGWGLSFMERSSNNRGVEETAPCTAVDRHGPPDCCMGDLSSGAACVSPQVRKKIDKDSVSGDSCPDYAQKLANTRKNRLKVDMTVILPAGDHGLPVISEDDAGMPGSYGPTPLLERWTSGGDCECGGWDMGCGLSVFKAETLTLCRRTPTIALTRNDHMNWLSPGNPFKLLTQGYRCKKVLVLEIIEAGLFSLSFQARVSPLQAFAIAVALFHQQMTSN